MVKGKIVTSPKRTTLFIHRQSLPKNIRITTRVIPNNNCKHAPLAAFADGISNGRLMPPLESHHTSGHGGEIGLACFLIDDHH